MALSNAERQRRHYERQKAKRKEALKKAEHFRFSDFASEPFFEVFKRRAGTFSDFFGFFDTAGLDAPDIADDSDPASLTGQIELGYAPGESPYDNGGGSLARAEIMVGCLIEAAGELAGIINRYKQDEISAYLARLESSLVTDPEDSKETLSKILMFRKMLEELEKDIRINFRQWKVTPG